MDKLKFLLWTIVAIALLVALGGSVEGSATNSQFCYSMETLSGNVISDTSGNGEDLRCGDMGGSCNRPAGKFGTYSLRFDGADYATNDIMWDYENWTIIYWMRTNITGDFEDYHFGMQDGNDRLWLRMRDNSDEVRSLYRSAVSGAADPQSTGTDYTGGTWHQFGMRGNAETDEYDLIIDNVSVNSDNVAVNYVTWDENFTVGNLNAGGFFAIGLEGDIDSFCVFDYELNASEINDHFKTGLETAAPNNTAPSAAINFPPDDYTRTGTSINVSGTGTDAENVSLTLRWYLNDTLNATNTSGVSGTAWVYDITDLRGDSNYTLIFQACDWEFCTNSSEVFFSTVTDPLMVMINNVTANNELFINDSDFNDTNDIVFNTNYEVNNSDKGDFTNTTVTNLTDLQNGRYDLNVEVCYDDVCDQTGNLEFTVSFSPTQTTVITIDATSCDNEECEAAFTVNNDSIELSYDMPADQFNGWWQFNNASIIDSTGKNTKGDPAGNGEPVFKAGGSFDSSGMYFTDGINDAIEVANQNPLNVGSSLTVGGWFKSDCNPSGGTECRMIQKGGGGQTTAAYVLDLDDHSGSDSFHFCVNNNGDSQPGCVSSTTLGSDTNVWQHVVGTWDGSTVRIYVNGTEEATSSYSASMTTNTGALTFGGRPDYGSDWYRGLMDEIFIYNRTLNQNQIEQIYNQTRISIGNYTTEIENTITNNRANITIGCTEPTSTDCCMIISGNDTCHQSGTNNILLSSGKNRNISVRLTTTDNSTTSTFFNYSITVFTGAAPPPVNDTCTYVSGDWNIDCADNCVFTSTQTVDPGSVVRSQGAGTVTGVRYISGADRIRISGGCKASA